MALFDDIWGFIGEYGDDIVSAGSQIYDIYRSTQSADIARQALEPGGITDPFGAERPYYQSVMRQAYQDPTGYLDRLPGFQVASEMGSRAVERAAAKSGHFHSPNRLQALADFNQKLATRTWGSEMDRLSTLAGAGISPDARAYDPILQSKRTSETAQSAGGKTLADQILGYFNGDSQPGGEQGVGDVATDAAKAAAEKYAEREGGSLWDTAKDALFGEEYVTSLQGVPGDAVAGTPTADFYQTDLAKAQATGTDIMGQVPTSTGGGVQVPGTLSESYQGFKEMAGGGTALTAAGGAAGGVAGAWAANKLFEGTRFGETPLPGYLGGVAGTAAGAAGTAAATGAAAGTAAMAAAGPAAIAGAVLMIGQGIAGMVKGKSARNEFRDRVREDLTPVLSSPTVADPTGQGVGPGYAMGNMFLPASQYQALLAKMRQGDAAQKAAHESATTMQSTEGRLYGFRRNKAGEWEYGSLLTNAEQGEDMWESGTWQGMLQQLQDKRTQELVRSATSNPTGSAAQRLSALHPDQYQMVAGQRTDGGYVAPTLATAEGGPVGTPTRRDIESGVAKNFGGQMWQATSTGWKKQTQRDAP